ncbi:MAG: hypothetical protein QM770_15330 [Tepidisphaeraceae bacterium]
MNARFENLSLRDALAAVTSKLGLRFELQSEVVQLRPSAALSRIGRRASVQELHTLDVLSTRPLAATSTKLSVTDLLAAVDAALQALDAELDKAGQKPAGLVLEFRPGDSIKADQEIYLPRNVTVAQALDELAQQTKAAWYPWGDTLVVQPKKQIVRNMLERTIHVRYDGVDVATVLTDLADKAGVPFMVEPGALQRVPTDYRSVKLIVDAPARQALESLAGVTGLGYVATDDGVYLWNNSPVQAQPQGRIVATLDIGNGMQALITEDMLSDEAKAALDAKTKAAVEKLKTSAK